MYVVYIYIVIEGILKESFALLTDPRANNSERKGSTWTDERLPHPEHCGSLLCLKIDFANE